MRHSRRRCTAPGCREIAVCGITQPERCPVHAWEGDANLVEQQCVVTFGEHGRCPMVDVLDAEGRCATCAWHAGAKRPRLSKQREVVQYLERNLPEHPFTSIDRVPADVRSCGGLERPDVLWDYADRIVILEVDERQHEERPCECEQTRMMNVSQAMGCERTLWIRYNPDTFKSPEARQWTSNGKRLAVLQRWLRWALTAELEHTIGVVHLFFDGFAEGNVRVQRLL